MAKSRNQKLKLLYLKDYLLENTDEEHGVTISEITAYLQSNDILAERKSLYDDIDLLRSVYGMDICTQKIAKRVEYRVASRKFDMHELKLLGDAVQSSKFITEKKSNELIDKLKGECSRHEAEKLSRQILCTGKVKNMNESIYYNVDSLFEAISSDRCVLFRYFNYTFDKQKEFRRDGARYEVSPLTLVYSEDKYYLIGYDLSVGAIRHFRVDRMTGIEIGSRARNAKEFFSGIDVAKYTDMHFSMFGGEIQRVRLCFDKKLANTVYDRFSSDNVVYDKGDGSYEMYVSLAVSEQFFGWLAGLGGGAKIISPQNVRDDYISFLDKVMKNA